MHTSLCHIYSHHWTRLNSNLNLQMYSDQNRVFYHSSTIHCTHHLFPFLKLLYLLFYLLPKILYSCLHCYSNTLRLLLLVHFSRILSTRHDLSISCILVHFFIHSANCLYKCLLVMLFYLNKRWNTISMFHTIFKVPFIKISRAVPENSQTISFVLAESTFKIGSVTIKDLTFSFFDSIVKSA